MKALNDYLILKKDGRERVTESGIILPDFGSENDNLGKPYTGVIQSKGWDVSDKYGVGDRVIYSDMCNPQGYYDTDTDEVYLVIKEKDIVGILE